MKSPFILLVVVLIGILGSCGSNSNTVHLKGTVSNADSELIELVIPDTSYIIKVDSSGVFDATIKFSKPGYVSMNYGGRFNTMYLEPGYDLQISFDVENIQESLIYEGQGEIANNVLNLLRKEASKLPTDNEIMSNDESVFLMKVDSISNLLNELLTLNKSQLGSEFFEMETAKINYSKAEMMVRYPLYHGYLVDEPEFKVSESYWKKLRQFPVDESNYVGIYPFDNFVYGLIDLELSKSSDLSVLEKFRKSQELVDEIIADPAVRNLCYTHNFYKYLASGISYDDAKPFYDRYVGSFKEFDKNQFTDVLDRLSSIQPGLTSPDFKFVSMYGDTVRSEVLEGKVLFLSVWSTTNEEFLNDLPQLLELHNKYSNEIQFIYVSVDDYIEEWQLLVREMNMPDIQLFASEGWSDPFLYSYVIEQLPRYILINQDGNIINSYISITGPEANAENEIRSAISNLNL